MNIQIIFLISLYSATLIYQRTYETTNIQNTIKLENTKQYLIQLNIVKFPDEQSCLPILQINSTLDESIQVLYDEIGYSTKSRIQQIYVTADSIQIAVYNKYLTMIKNTNQSELITFQLSIFDSPPQKQLCQFPSYGIDCQQKIEEIETETLLTLIVPKNSWNYIYYILDNYDYVIEAESQWASFFVALLPVDKTNSTKLPSFLSKYFLIQENSESVNLGRLIDIESYLFVVGVYNFDNEAEITISLNIKNSNQEDQFPLWAILTIIGVFLLGIAISIFIICQLRKQAKVYEEKPKIPLEILDKYMQLKQVPKTQLTESCCVCLIQFIRKDQIRETPCKHFFHGKCLQDWTKKNSTCPVCRQELGEEELKKIMCLNQISIKNEIDNSNQGELPKIPFTQLRISDHEINTRGIIIIDNSPSHQQSHSDRLSINLIEDQIVEH